MAIKLNVPKLEQELRPRITVIGVGGAGGNAVNNMIRAKLEGVDFVVANTDSQALAQSLADRTIQLGVNITHGLGAGARPDVGRAAAEEAIDGITEQLRGANMAFITAGMGGGTGTGAAPVIARIARELGVLTVGVVTKPFQFEGVQRARMADSGIEDMHQYVDTLIIIPNQNLFRVANEKTTFADAFAMADDVLHSGVRGVTDLMVVPGLINLDFADIRSVMTEMGKAMMGTGEAEGDNRARAAAEAAISNPLLDDVSMKGAKGVLINITGGPDLTLYEVDEAANRIGDEVDDNANIIFGSTLDPLLEGRMRVSVVATGIDSETTQKVRPVLTVVNEPFRGVPPRPPAPRPAPAPVASFAAPRPAEAPAPAVEAVRAAPEVAPAESETATAAARAAETARAAEIADPFLPPAPAETARRPARAEPIPAIETATEPAPRRTRERGSVSSLFQRMAGVGRTRAEARPAERQAAPPVVPAPTLPIVEPAQPRAEAAAPRIEAPRSEPVRHEPEQPTLANLEGAERLRSSQNEEDLLEIPAFLRRQAN
ncbi:MAG TPA: cell division protein FtsZ [Alphaproteobacteria bacterium]